MRLSEPQKAAVIVVGLLMAAIAMAAVFSPPTATPIASAVDSDDVRPTGCTETVSLTVLPGDAVVCNRGAMVAVTKSWFQYGLQVTCTCPPEHK